VEEDEIAPVTSCSREAFHANLAIPFLARLLLLCSLLVLRRQCRQHLLTKKKKKHKIKEKQYRGKKKKSKKEREKEIIKNQ